MRNKFQWVKEGEKTHLFLTALFKVTSGVDYGEFISILLKNYYLITQLLQIEKYICIFKIYRYHRNFLGNKMSYVSMN